MTIAGLSVDIFRHLHITHLAVEPEIVSTTKSYKIENTFILSNTTTPKPASLLIQRFVAPALFGDWSLVCGSGAGQVHSEPCEKMGLMRSHRPSAPHRYVAPGGLLQDYGKKVI